MNDEKKPQQSKDSSEEKADFHGAAIIDEEGHEVPITEEMVQKACQDLGKKKD